MKKSNQKRLFSDHCWLMLPPLVLAALLGGCATPATHEGMAPAVVGTARTHPHSVSVAVTGGKETDSIGKPQISDEAMAQALTDAIVRSQTFSRVVQGKGADYLLTVTIISIEQPTFGFSFLVKMEAGWTLKRADTGATVWQESIRSEHTATAADSFAGVTRLRLATEGAARSNITRGLASMQKRAF